MVKNTQNTWILGNPIDAWDLNGILHYTTEFKLTSNKTDDLKTWILNLVP